MTACWLAPLLLVASAAGLALSNPGPQEFGRYAGDRLVETITQELCTGSALPLAWRLVLQNCPDLVASQRQALGGIALHHSTRTNLGVASLYRTEIGGQRLLPELVVPRYEALTLAAAGQFLVLRTGESDGRQGEAPGPGARP